MYIKILILSVTFPLTLSLTHSITATNCAPLGLKGRLQRSLALEPTGVAVSVAVIGPVLLTLSSSLARGAATRSSRECA